MIEQFLFRPTKLKSVNAVRMPQHIDASVFYDWNNEKLAITLHYNDKPLQRFEGNLYLSPIETLFSLKDKDGNQLKILKHENFLKGFLINKEESFEVIISLD